MDNIELLEKVNDDLAELGVSAKAHVQRQRIIQNWIQMLKQNEQNKEAGVIEESEDG